MRHLGLTIGGFIALVVFSAVGVLAQDHGTSPSAAAYLRLVDKAIQLYVMDNRGHLPLEFTLVQRYLRGAPAPPTGWNFVLVAHPGKGLGQLRSDGMQPLALAVPAADRGGPVGVLYANGSVQAYAPTDERALAAGAATRPANPIALAKPPAQPPEGDLAKAIVGTWKVKVGLHLARYEFNPDGTFRLTFTLAAPTPGYEPPGSGTATGTWRIDGRTLVMVNQASDTPHTVAGEEERAEIARFTDTELVLKTTDNDGKAEEVTLDRSIPFAKGKRDNEKIIGTWHSGQLTLVLADSGMAVFGPLKGEWSQRGSKLLLNLPQRSSRGGLFELPGDAAQSKELTIDLVDDTTLVLSGDLASLLVPRQEIRQQELRPATMTLLRVK